MRFQNFLMILLTLREIFAARILFLFPTPGKSHMIIVHSLSTFLAQRGHDVTVLSPFKYDKEIKNHREILIPFADEIMRNFTKESFENPNQSLIKTLPCVINIATNITKELINLQKFQRILKEEKFDLVVVGMFFNNFLLGYGDHFKCPTVMLSVVASTFISNNLIGNAPESNAVPTIVLNSPNPMRLTFIERVKNFLMAGGEKIINAYINYKLKIIYE